MQEDMRLTLKGDAGEPERPWHDDLRGIVGYVRALAERVDRIEALQARATEPEKAGDEAEADRVMVRAVSPSHPGPDDEWCTWVLDPDATGHRAPFASGDLVIETTGYRGIQRVVDVSVDKDAPRHRSLRLTVKRADVVVDADAF